METSCGKISDKDRDEIKQLFQRKLALGELFQSLTKMETSKSSALYEKIVMDMGETAFSFSRWWEQTARRYKWPSNPTGNWRLDFDSCEVFLVEV